MKISVKAVEGTTTKRGAKQNKVYTVIAPSTTENFYKATDGKANFTLWNVNGDWTLLGIRKEDCLRMSYCNSFAVEN